MVSVAARFLDDVELGEASVKESLAVHMAEEHLSVTKVRLGGKGDGLVESELEDVLELPETSCFVELWWVLWGFVLSTYFDVWTSKQVCFEIGCSRTEVVYDSNPRSCLHLSST